MPKEKLKTTAFEVPKNGDEVNRDIEEIGRLQRERDRIQAEMNDEMADIKAKHEEQNGPIIKKLAGLMKGVHAYCETNREGLTKEGKVKHHIFATGRVEWRITPKKVGLSKVADVLASIKSLGLAKKFIRTAEEVDKEAMLKDEEKAAGIKGVKISQKEEFAIKPNETELEEIAA